MPFYEYTCKACGHDLEAMQKISDPPLKKCPQCGKTQLQRLMSAPVFRLKGGGWYETDFKGDQDNKRNLADRPEAEAPKETAGGAQEGAKDTGGAAAEGAAPDGKGKDAAPAKDAAGAKDAPKEKSADKSTAPTAATSADAGKRAARAHTPGRGKSAHKRPIKRAVHKAKRRI